MVKFEHLAVGFLRKESACWVWKPSHAGFMCGSDLKKVFLFSVVTAAVGFQKYGF